MRLPLVAPRFRCETCGNTEQNNFITDYARGDTICNGVDGNGCGTVVQDHIVHEGSAYRKFEGEEDKSHHGPAPNKLFSSGHNLRTMISQVRRPAQSKYHPRMRFAPVRAFLAASGSMSAHAVSPLSCL
jgi:transcription initiation factor TFIIIB Brf1 subunit/transcription initiation factor TFIIB